MLIGVISDTHDDVRAIRKFGELFRTKGVELIIHAGDWVSPFSFLKMRRAVGEIPIVTVLGNNEGERINLTKMAKEARVEVLGEAGSLDLDGRRIGIYHGTSAVLLE